MRFPFHSRVEDGADDGAAAQGRGRGWPPPDAPRRARVPRSRGSIAGRRCRGPGRSPFHLPPLPTYSLLAVRPRVPLQSPAALGRTRAHGAGAFALCRCALQIACGHRAPKTTMLLEATKARRRERNAPRRRARAGDEEGFGAGVPRAPLRRARAGAAPLNPEQAMASARARQGRQQVLSEETGLGALAHSAVTGRQAEERRGGVIGPFAARPALAGPWGASHTGG
jgi:hypothetical protein